MTPTLKMGRSRPGSFFAAIAAILGSGLGLGLYRARPDMPLQREPLDPALPPAPSRPRYEDNEPHPSGMNRKQRRAAIITGRATLQRRNPFRGVCGFVPGITAKHVQLRRCSYP